VVSSPASPTRQRGPHWRVGLTSCRMAHAEFRGFQHGPTLAVMRLLSESYQLPNTGAGALEHFDWLQRLLVLVGAHIDGAVHHAWVPQIVGTYDEGVSQIV
jgi:hypothetical protein